MSRPNTKYTSAEIADWHWTHTSNAEGGFTSDQIQTAALIAIAQTMRRIERQIGSLGSDGIHQLIREQLKALRRAARKRRIAARRRRKGAKP